MLSEDAVAVAVAVAAVECCAEPATGVWLLARAATTSARRTVCAWSAFSRNACAADTTDTRATLDPFAAGSMK